MAVIALAGMAQGTECQIEEQKVTGSIPIERVHAWVVG